MKLQPIAWVATAAIISFLGGCSLVGNGAVPAAPTGLKVSGPTVSSLTVSWSASSGATNYQVFRGASKTGPFNSQDQIYAGLKTTTVDGNLSPDTTYYYVVEATDSAGTSQFSKAVSATTLGNVYVGGSVGTSASSLAPVYWKNDTLSNLSMASGDNYGTAEFVTSDTAGNIYIAGCTGGSSSKTTPVYWKNGVSNTMSFGATGTTGTADGVRVDSSGTSTVAGWMNATGDPVISSQIPVYWVDGGLYVLSMLNNKDTVGAAWGPAVNALADVFFAGYEGTSTSSTIPVYWKNGVPTGLSLGASGYEYGSADVVVIDESQNIYVAGSAGGSASTTRLPVYWENGTLYSLPTIGNTYGSVTAGSVDASGNVYFSGFVGTSSSNTPVYWKNGVMQVLSPGSGNSYGQATGLVVDSWGNVYVSGNVGSTSSLGTPVYWENDTLHSLSMGSKTYGSAAGIALGK